MKGVLSTVKVIVRFLAVAVLLCACSGAIFATTATMPVKAMRADGTVYTINKPFYRLPNIYTSWSGAPLSAFADFENYPGFVDWTPTQQIDLDRYEESFLASPSGLGSAANFHRVISSTLGFNGIDLFWWPKSPPYPVSVSHQIDESNPSTWPYIWTTDWTYLCWPPQPYAADYYVTCVIWNDQLTWGSYNPQVGDLAGPIMEPIPQPGCANCPRGVIVAINPQNPYDLCIRVKEGAYGLYDERCTIGPNTVGFSVCRSSYGLTYTPSPQYPPYLFWEH